MYKYWDKYYPSSQYLQKYSVLANVKGRFSGDSTPYPRIQAQAIHCFKFSDVPYFWLISDQTNRNESVIIFF